MMMFAELYINRAHVMPRKDQNKHYQTDKKCILYYAFKRILKMRLQHNPEI